MGGKFQKTRKSAISPYAATLTLILVVVVSGVMIHAFVKQTTTQVETGGEEGRLNKALIVEGYQVKNGFLVITLRNLGNTPSILKDAYLYTRDGALVGHMPIPETSIPPKGVAEVVLPPQFYNLLNKTQGQASLVIAGDAGGIIGASEPLVIKTTEIQEKIDSYRYILTFGYLTGNNGTDARRLDTSKDYWWFYLNLLTGDYEFVYHNATDNTNLTFSGKAFVTTERDPVIDLYAMTLDERFNLGPGVIAINPTRATDINTVTIIPTTDFDCSGSAITWAPNDNKYWIKAIMHPLTADANEVYLDALVMLEDWYFPGGKTRPIPDFLKYDNLLDLIARFTIFSNGTVRIEIDSVAGGRMSMVFYNATHPLPPINTLADYVVNYYNTDLSLATDPKIGLLFVKPGRTAMINTTQFFDPANPSSSLTVYMDSNDPQGAYTYPPCFSVGVDATDLYNATSGTYISSPVFVLGGSP